jgi:RNA polymerase sigma-70 factor (ECF subfamily)
MARRIYAFAFHRLRDADKAETVVVDTLFDVWKGASQFRGDALATTWILGIARFKTLSLLRKHELPSDDIDDFQDQLASDFEDGEAHLMRWQREQLVQSCMAELSPAHKECMQLVYFEGLGLSDVAAVQHVPENTVKTRLFHARKAMRKCVEQREGLSA